MLSEEFEVGGFVAQKSSEHRYKENDGRERERKERCLKRKGI